IFTSRDDDTTLVVTTIFSRSVVAFALIVPVTGEPDPEKDTVAFDPLVESLTVRDNTSRVYCEPSPATWAQPRKTSSSVIGASSSGASRTTQSINQKSGRNDAT